MECTIPSATDRQAGQVSLQLVVKPVERQVRSPGHIPNILPLPSDSSCRFDASAATGHGSLLLSGRMGGVECCNRRCTCAKGGGGGGDDGVCAVSPAVDTAPEEWGQECCWAHLCGEEELRVDVFCWFEASKHYSSPKQDSVEYVSNCT